MKNKILLLFITFIVTFKIQSQTLGYQLNLTNVSNSVSPLVFCSHDIGTLNVSSVGSVPTVIASIKGDSIPCSGVATKFEVPFWNGVSYTFSVTNGSFINTIQPNVIYVTDLYNSNAVVNCNYFSSIAGCGGNVSITIQVAETPTIVSSNVYCQFDTAQFTIMDNTALNWKWLITYPNDSIAKPITDSLQLLLQQSGNYTIGITGTNVCTLAPMQFKVTPKPLMVDSVIGEDTICVNKTYYYEIANPKVNLQYSWSTSAGAVISGNPFGEKIEVKYTGAGPWQISVKSVDINNGSCESPEKIINIIKEPVPRLAIMNFNNIACPNTRVQYEVNYTKADRYQWSIIPNRVASIEAGGNTPNPTIVWNNNAGLYEDSARIVVITTKCDRSYVDDWVVYFHPKVVLKLKYDSSLCRGSNAKFSLESTPTLTGASVIWNFGDGTTEIGGLYSNHTYNPNINKPTLYPVSAVVSNMKTGGTCTVIGGGTITHNTFTGITILPTPKIILSKITYPLICNGNIFDSLANASISIDTNYGKKVDSIIWTTPTGSSTSKYPNLLLSPTINKYGNYIATAYNQYGCNSSISFLRDSFYCQPVPPVCKFDSTPLPTISVTDYVAHCGSITLTGSHSAGGFNQTWTYDNTVITATTSTNTLNGFANNSGTYSIKYSADFLDDNGKACNYTATSNVIVPMVAKPAISYTCLADSNARHLNVILNNSVTAYPAGVTSVLNNGYWVNGANVLNSTLPYNTNTTQGVLFMGSNNNTAQINVNYNYNGAVTTCLSDTLHFNIPVPLKVGFTVNRTTTCAGIATVNFTNTSTGSYTNAVWDFGDNTSSLLDPTTAKVYEFNSDQTLNNKTATLTLQNNYGCIASSSKNITVVANKFAGDINPNVTTYFCPNDGVLLSYVPKARTSIGNYFQLFNTLHRPPSLSIAQSNTNGFNQNQYGNYWIQASDTTTGCFNNITTPTVNIVPVPLKQPSLISKATNPASTDTLFICQGLPFTLDIKGGAASNTGFEFYEHLASGVNNSLVQSSEPSYTEDRILDTGIHYYFVNASTIYISKLCIISSKMFVVVVREKPLEPIINTPSVIDCHSYQLQLSINNPQQGVYSWSNGSNGITTNINEGGPYKVWFSNGLGCSSSATVNVPINPKNYFWMLPNGCYSGCIPAKGVVVNMPAIKFPYWQWSINNTPFLWGTNTTLQPLPITLPGSYTLLINNGLCIDSSIAEAVNFSVPDTCLLEPNCPIIELKTITVYNKSLSIDTRSPLPTPTCDSVGISYTLQNFYLKTAVMYAVSCSWGQTFTGGVLPSATTQYNYLKLHIPAGVRNGIITVIFYYVVQNRIDTCMRSFNFSFNCDSSVSFSKQLKNKLNEGNVGLEIYPNPAKDFVNIKINKLVGTVQLSIIDHLGKVVKQATVSGNWSLVQTKSLPKGLYIVQVKQTNGDIMSGKLLLE